MATQEVQTNLIQKHPVTPEEITSNTGVNFMIKFSAVGCQPCVNLQKFLDQGSLKPKDSLTIYHVQVRDPKQEAVYNHLRKFFEFRSVPYCVVTNSNLELIDSMTGFKPETFISFVGNHFNLIN